MTTKLVEIPLLADENIHHEVVVELRQRGIDVIDIYQAGLVGAPDRAIITYANETSRAILTHDSDFGRLTILEGHPFLGVVLVRPGHIAPAMTLTTIDTIFDQVEEVRPPFLIVGERRGASVRIRLHQRA